MQTNADWLQSTTRKLSRAGISTARLDALILLEDATGKDRSWLLAHPEFDLGSLQDTTLQRLDEAARRRANHEPLAYIRGKTEFYGRQFLVNKYVLEPRPESETIIDLLKSQIMPLLESNQTIEPRYLVIDVGTGSGALAITAQLEMPKVDVIGIDIDENCLEIARKNAEILKSDIKFLQGDLLVPIQKLKPKNYSLLCNLPYVPDNFTINPAAMREPQLAIFGGLDGLDIYRKLFLQISQISDKPDYILAESLPPQHDNLAEIATESGYQLAKTDDFIQLFQQK